MPKFQVLRMSPLDILLDAKNPRFIIPPDTSQDNIRLYLLEYEEVASLAKSIIDYGGLMPGERVIVCKENDYYVVLEGNRRICACQLLLNPDLIPDKFNKDIPRITQETLDNISQIEVDAANSREEAQSTLAFRHIEGAKKWSTISKYKFFTNSFNNGKSIDEISELTRIKESKVEQGIKEYNLLMYALELPFWSEEDKSKLNLQGIKVTPYLRIFAAKNKEYNMTGAQLLKINYDENTLKPKSDLNEDVFKTAIYLIAKAAFVDNSINTRNDFTDVPGLIDLLNENNIIPQNDNKINSGMKKPNDIPNESNIPKNNSFDIKGPKDDQIKDSEQLPKSNNQTKDKEKDKGSSPSPPRFFENLTWAGVDKNDPENTGLIACADEIKRLSQYGHYSKYPISTAMLLRSLIEHTLKYYAKKTGFWKRIKPNPDDKDPKLEYIIQMFTKNKSNLFSDEVERIFSTVFENNSLKDFLDCIVHQTQNTRATKEILESIAKAGLFAFINAILNL
ncbi:ParB/Srx family N-terminal domain-containing protein [Thermoanaerobacterium sp. DL9XJH110]|uniref:ParB/Srx family N-terminal domain-containing protein n=1 Tax=Thermoanaerobacterium sp. DL9XJH110 TaxID=3386643 RepID=UPI003BB66CFD